MLNVNHTPLTTVRIILSLELYQVRNSTYYATLALLLAYYQITVYRTGHHRKSS